MTAVRDVDNRDLAEMEKYRTAQIDALKREIVRLKNALAEAEAENDRIRYVL